MCAFLITSFKVDAQDWANLKRYQAENAELKTPEKHENRVVFMGNSITQGWVETRPEFFKNNAYIGRGISGQTTPQMLVRFRQDVIALQPKAVVILAGTNDIAGNTGPSTLEMIIDNLASMAEVARANNIKVILCSVLPAYDYPWKKGMEPHIKIPTLHSSRIRSNGETGAASHYKGFESKKIKKTKSHKNFYGSLFSFTGKIPLVSLKTYLVIC